MTYTLTLAHLYPEQMNIYGDRGNIIALTQRCLWRGIELRLLPVDVGTEVDWMACDLAFFGGGQDSGQALIAEDFVQRHGPSLSAAIDDGLVMLTICGGYQLLGHYFLTHTGEKLPGIGALDVHTVGGTKRLIGNALISWEMGDGRWGLGDGSEKVEGGRQEAGGEEGRRQKAEGRRQEAGGREGDRQPTTFQLVGFENHSGRTYLGAGARSLGRVLVGSGNNGEDGTGGAVYRNTFGCYLHGSLLPKNPQFADHLIELALHRRYGAASLNLLDDTLELRAQHTMIERLV